MPQRESARHDMDATSSLFSTLQPRQEKHGGKQAGRVKGCAQGQAAKPSISNQLLIPLLMLTAWKKVSLSQKKDGKLKP